VTAPPDLDRLRAEAAAALDAADGFEQPWMRAVFLKVARHAFVPDRVWVWSTDAYQPLRRTADPVGWARLVHDPVGSVVTQVDDGHPGPAGGTLPTSSISAPNAVFTMLAAARLEPGQRVLEVGTGTGYNAALLCERVGEQHVTSVEIDPEVAADARRALRAEGYRPVVVTADGESGHPPRAPYDRIISTASVHQVPGAWIAQAAPGALVVTPWRSTLQPLGLVTLRVSRGGRAEGHFGSPMAFMDVRGQRRSDHSPLGALYTPETWRDSAERGTDAELDWLTDDFHARFAAGLMLPGTHAEQQRSPGAAPAWWLSSATSWARVAGGRVRLWGPRDLLADLEQAHGRWTKEGRPELYEYGLTVTADGDQHPWLGNPDRPLWRA
jgi:protein-L-isoaspartate O-methyltransferase